MRTLARTFGLLSILLLASAALAEGDGLVQTGEGIRIKKVIGIKVKVYQISHFMKSPPAQKSKQAIVDADVEKKFSWRMLRSVGGEKIANALREGYNRNGYKDDTKINAIMKPMASELKEGSVVTIAYDPGAKATTLTANGTSATVNGVDFMKATWSIWFGVIDQQDLQDALMAKLP